MTTKHKGDSHDPQAYKGKSGEHPAVMEFRRKMESIQEGTFHEIEALNARMLRKHPSSPPKKKEDPRREPSERHDSEVPEDVVDVPDGDPFPSPLPPAPEKK